MRLQKFCLITLSIIVLIFLSNIPAFADNDLIGFIQGKAPLYQWKIYDATFDANNYLDQNVYLTIGQNNGGVFDVYNSTFDTLQWDITLNIDPHQNLTASYIYTC